ncbi:MAG: biotin transporter BioY [Oscillospiraceae bacterium]
MRTRKIILTGLFAALTAIGAFIRIPTPISSFTLQVFFTCMAGLLLGPGLGAASQAVYVLLGLVGLPIFTQGGGFSYVTQPTFGFLLGLIPAAWVAGMIARRGAASFCRLLLACLAGTAAVYVIGLPYMHCILRFYLNKTWSIQQTVMGGMVIFLPWDVLKAIVASLLAKKLLPTLHKVGLQY